jgi:hypothetical protein
MPVGGRGVQERHRPVGDRELARADVVRELIPEVVLQVGAVGALRFGVNLQLDGSVLEPGPDAELVLRHLDQWGIEIALGSATDGPAAPAQRDDEAERHGNGDVLAAHPRILHCVGHLQEGFRG